MTIFAIGDLHLSGSGEKPMNVFGPHWENHFERISARWREMVSPEDYVLIPGDISWAMQFDEAKTDLLRIAALPGVKVLLRGNHDYWWSSITRLRSFLPKGMLALQNDSIALPGLALCGTRGWVFPTSGFPLDAQEEKVYQRELIRLEMTLSSAAKEHLPILAMLHYPPLLMDHRDTAFTALLEKYGVSLCVYGHLHSAGIQNGFTGMHGGVRYRLVSCDALDFTPVKVWDGAPVAVEHELN